MLEALLLEGGYEIGPVEPLDVTDFVPVPPDGLCLFYTAIAARNVASWMEGRDTERGWQTNREAEMAQELEAKALRDQLIRELDIRDEQVAADSLRQGEYPGDHELPHLARILQCRIRRLHPREPPRLFGDAAAPLAFAILHQELVGEDGAVAPHWVLKETWMQPDALYTLTDGLPPVRRQARRARATEFFEVEADVDGSHHSEDEGSRVTNR